LKTVFEGEIDGKKEDLYDKDKQSKNGRPEDEKICQDETSDSQRNRMWNLNKSILGWMASDYDDKLLKLSRSMVDA
jgi:hypothetical protein